MEERYHFTLSDELLEKAVKELHEPRDDEGRWEAIDKLRESYDSEKYGPLIRSDDAFLLRFLRAKKFSQEKSLNMLQNYHKVQKQYKDVFVKVSNPALIRPIVEQGALLMLDGNTKQGACCLFYRTGLLDPNADPWDLTAYGIMCMEKMLENEQYQICGMEIIEDFADFSLTLLAKMSTSVSKMKGAMQDAMPCRIRGIHILNEGTVFDLLMAIARPFMRKKILDRIHVYGAKYELMHKHISPAILPPYLGGTGPEPSVLSEKWIDILTEEMTQDTPL
uniref:Uncharacterized protein LOC101243387 n=1 Tax=Phallusia mammillata TaxID=59560 RepID=A0A6F9DJI0_9ASCI|nr:uncharacterized protein LOC101243387 [Phallusia mammillata]